MPDRRSPVPGHRHTRRRRRGRRGDHAMRILLWHVHGSWTTAFVQGRHEYVVPVTPDRGPDGLGRARTWDWPASVREVPLDHLAEAEPDVVILQRPHEEELVRGLGRTPLVYLEH